MPDLRPCDGPQVARTSGKLSCMVNALKSCEQVQHTVFMEVIRALYNHDQLTNSAEPGRYAARARSLLSKWLGFTEVVGVTMTHPQLPIFAYRLGALPMASNGARVNLWGSPDPLCLCTLNVNHIQTRKSPLTALAESLAAAVDQYCTEGFEGGSGSPNGRRCPLSRLRRSDA